MASRARCDALLASKAAPRAAPPAVAPPAALETNPSAAALRACFPYAAARTFCAACGSWRCRVFEEDATRTPTPQNSAETVFVSPSSGRRYERVDAAKSAKTRRYAPRVRAPGAAPPDDAAAPPLHECQRLLGTGRVEVIFEDLQGRRFGDAPALPRVGTKNGIGSTGRFVSLFRAPRTDPQAAARTGVVSLRAQAGLLT